MDGRIRWDRINALGYAMENVLSRLVVICFLVMLLLLLVRAEWQLLPSAARAEVICGAEMAAVAPLALVVGGPAESVQGRLAEWPDHCAAAVPSNPTPSEDDDLSTLWAVPVTLSPWEEAY